MSGWWFSLHIGEYFELLRSCEQHSEYGVSTHYKSLGWSAGRGTRVRNKLVKLNWIEINRVVSPKGGRPREILSLTEEGKRSLHEHP